MKVYLLDTNIASALWDGGAKDHNKATQFINDATADGSVIYISRIVIAEIEYGCKLHVSADPARRNNVEVAMRAFTSIREIRKETTDPYSTIRAALFSKFGTMDSRGRVTSKRPELLVDKTTALQLGIQENDLWMAALAVERNMTLVSEDRMKSLKEAWPTLDLVKWK